MTSLYSGNADDYSQDLGDIGFSIPFYTTTYRYSIRAVSNSFVTFNYLSTASSGFAYSSAVRGIFLNPGDRSFQDLYMKQDISGESCRIRFEGSLTTAMATPRNLVWELTLFVEGAIMISSAQAMTNCYITDGTGNNYTVFAIGANSSGVLIPSGTGYAFSAGSYG